MTAPSRAPALPRHGPPALPLAVTMGDPAGIGPDITLAAWLQRRRRALCRLLSLYGDRDALASRARVLHLDVPLARGRHAG